MDWKRAYKINIANLPHPRYGSGKLRVVHCKLSNFMNEVVDKT